MDLDWSRIPTRVCKQQSATQNKTKPKQPKNTKKWDRYQQWDDILCVMMRMAPNKKQNKETQKTRSSQVRGCKKQQSSMQKPGIPQPGSPSPRDYKEQPFRHDIHPDTSKQTPTTPGRNESGEKQENGETGR